MDNNTFHTLELIALWITVETAVKKEFTENQVTSSVLSAQELIDLKVRNRIELIMTALSGAPAEEYVKEYQEKVRFIESLIHKM